MTAFGQYVLMSVFAILGMTIIVADKQNVHSSPIKKWSPVTESVVGEQHAPAIRMTFMQDVLFPAYDYSPLLNYNQTPDLPRFVFGLLAHNSNTVGGLIELLEKVYSARHLYVIHLDSKVEWSDYMRVTTLFKSKSNVVFTKNRINVRWGSFTIIQAELEILYTAAQYSITKSFSFDYFLILDGSCYPLVPLHTIETEISRWPSQSNIVFSNNQTQQGRDTPTCYPTEKNEGCHRTKSRCLDSACTKYSLTPNNGVIYKGTQWVILSRELVNFVLTDDSYLVSWIKFFLNTWVPDELFFQTLLLNSPMKKKRYQPVSEFVFTNWDNCNHYRNPRMFSPCYHGTKDVPMLMASGSLFARKFINAEPAKKEIDKMAKELYSKKTGITHQSAHYN